MIRVQQVWEHGTKIKPFFLIIVTTIITTLIATLTATILLNTLVFPVSASSAVSVELPVQQVQAGDNFDIFINITPSTAVAGAQFDLDFDSSIVSVTNVEEGDFFDRNGVLSIFIPGTVDNQQGKVSGLFAVTLGQAVIDSPGNFARITLTAGEQAGESTIRLSNVILSNASGSSIPTTVENAQFTITGTSTADQTEEAAASSGGGGGGGGDTGESAENIELKEVNKLYITGNSDVKYTFADSDNPIKAISYTSLKNAGFISSTIEVLKDVSTTVSDKPDGIIYRNMNIWIGKAGYATESNMEDMKISFGVLKSWVRVNGIETNDIRLNRYHDDEWQVLDTEMTGEDNDFYFFEATTPGFSPFSITANVADEIYGSEPEVETEIENKPVNAASSYDNNELNVQIDEIEVEELSDSTSTYIKGKAGSAKLSQNGLLLSLVSVSCIVLLRRREKM
nr:PGF-pre-PGF domain-containing protein [uncultured Methanolobus sp.]